VPTYTCYPTAGAAGVAVDGYASRQAVAESWSALRSGSGTNHVDAGVTAEAGFYSNVSSNQWAGCFRGIILFDTSAIPVGETITSATVSLYVTTKTNSKEYTTQFDIYTSAPSSNSTVHSADYSTLGTTSQTTGAITLNNMGKSRYNDWPLSATGLGNIIKGGITKFGVRERTYDAQGATPTWTAAADFEMFFSTADSPTSAQRPKLVVVTTAPGVVYNQTPSGGIVFGGSVVIAYTRTLNHTPTGGIALVGSAATSINGGASFAPTGGIRLGGSVIQSVGGDSTPSGGIVFGGSASSASNIRLVVHLLSAGIEVASWTHTLGGSQARVSWTQLQLPPGDGTLTPIGGIRLGGSAVTSASISVTGTRALVNAVGKAGAGGTTHAVIGARAAVSVSGRAGGNTRSNTIFGTRAVVGVYCSADWGCGVRILFVEDSAPLFLDPVPSSCS